MKHTRERERGREGGGGEKERQEREMGRGRVQEDGHQSYAPTTSIMTNIQPVMLKCRNCLWVGGWVWCVKKGFPDAWQKYK